MLLYDSLEVLLVNCLGVSYHLKMIYDVEIVGCARHIERGSVLRGASSILDEAQFQKLRLDLPITPLLFSRRLSMKPLTPRIFDG
jgi:hypothetical protein